VKVIPPGSPALRGWLYLPILKAVFWKNSNPPWTAGSNFRWHRGMVCHRCMQIPGNWSAHVDPSLRFDSHFIQKLFQHGHGNFSAPMRIRDRQFKIAFHHEFMSSAGIRTIPSELAKPFDKIAAMDWCQAHGNNNSLRRGIIGGVVRI